MQPHAVLFETIGEFEYTLVIRWYQRIIAYFVICGKGIKKRPLFKKRSMPKYAEAKRHGMWDVFLNAEGKEMERWSKHEIFDNFKIWVVY